MYSFLAVFPKRVEREKMKWDKCKLELDDKSFAEEGEESIDCRQGIQYAHVEEVI